ncbi:MAG: insulinase family protein [Opitutaceae bacterium]|nr:insulinase family protein [Opitutaceae bacterium]
MTSRLHLRVCGLPFLLLICTALFTAAHASTLAPLLSVPFSERRADLEPDPAIVSGRLENGVRYLARRNAIPEGRISLRMVIAAGSLHEEEHERGVAHFVEHMAFRGSKLHPGEALPALLQREGFAFGPDNTAFTNYDHTIYHLEVPRNDEATLRRALEVFYEYANHLSFEPDHIEKERGVILSEKAVRDTAEARGHERSLQGLFPSSRVVQRAPIGTEEIIRTCTRETLVGFYDKWYRPERVGILAAGDMDPKVLERLIRDIFAPMTARAPAPAIPPDILPTATGQPTTLVVRDSGSVGSVMVFLRPLRLPNTIEDNARRVETMQRNVAFAAFQRRLARMSQENAEALVSPAVQLYDVVTGWQAAWFSASGRLDGWEKLARRMEQEHRRAMLFGFTPDEIEPIRKHFLESLDAGIRTQETEDSRSSVSRLVSSLLYGFPVITPQAMQAELGEALIALTPEDCHRIFRETWGEEPLHIRLFANESLKITDADLSRALKESQAVAVSPHEASTAVEFAYQTFGRATERVNHRHLEDLDVHLARFANGVRLNFKHTEFEKDTVAICVRIAGGGRLSLKKKQAGLDWFAAWSFVSGGLGKHSPTELNDILSGRTLSGGFYSGTDSFMLTARCARRDLQLMMKVLAAHVIDPGYREQALPVAKSTFGSMITDLVASPSGVIRVSMDQILFGNDPRFAMPVQDNFSPETLSDMRKWLTPHLQKGPVEIAVVGDARWDDVSGIVSRTFGALAPRSEKFPKHKVPDFAKSTGRPYLFQSHPSVKQAAILIAYPMPDCQSLSDTRRAHMLAAAIEERVRRTLREELGSAYVFDASFMEDDALSGLNRMIIHAEVNPERIDQAVDRLRSEVRNLATSGFTEDEFLRARNPVVRAYRDEMNTNDYWLFTVLSQAQTNPKKLAAVKTRLPELEGITRFELNQMVGRYLHADRAFEFVSLPAKPAP